MPRRSGYEPQVGVIRAHAIANVWGGPCLLPANPGIRWISRLNSNALPEDTGKFILRHGFAEQVALDLVASLALKYLVLLLRFHTFSDHLHLEAAPQGKNRLDQRHIVGIAVQVSNKGSIDFQGIQSKALETAQGGIARPKIVKQDLAAELPNVAQRSINFCQVLQKNAFRDLEIKEGWVDRGLTQDLG